MHKKQTNVRQNTSCLEVYVFNVGVFFYSESVYAHHGGHDPADVDGVVSFQVVHSSVLLVLGADLEQIQAGLQNIGLILYRQRGERKKRELNQVVMKHIND